MRTNKQAFTLIEVLVVIATIAILAGLLLPALSKAKGKASNIQCISQQRQIGLATLLFVDDHEGRLPRSTHSAAAHNELPWGYALAAYLSPGEFVRPDSRWTNLLTSIYRCPLDRRPVGEWSYGKNVYPELSASETGGPTWPKLEAIPRPVATVLYGEKKGGSMADHFMANFWQDGGEPEVDQYRHGRTANYVMSDGHVAAIPFKKTYDPDKNIDNWNPETAH